MHLFLTSSPCDDAVPEGCDLPCIFFERNSFVHQLQECFVPGKIFVAIAAYPDAYALNDEMLNTFRGCFAWHGMHFTDAVIIDNRNRQDAARLVRESSVIMLSGGHVPTENAFFKELGLKELLSGYEGIIMGVSAGSMNSCGHVYAQPEESGEATNPAYQRFITGLGLTDVMVLPHYNMVHDNYVDGMHLFRDLTIPDSMGHIFYALMDGSYVLTDGRHASLYGESWLIRDGEMVKLQKDGEVCTLPIA